MAQPSIKLENVSLDFPIYDSNARSIRRSLVDLTRSSTLSIDARERIIVKALDRVTLDIRHGDRVALVGHNGAGKSTLLRMLAKVYEPTSGRLHVAGRVAGIFDLNVGIDLEATGHENITLRGLLLGLGKREIEIRRQEIAEFSGLGSFLDVPVKTYSSGMQLRLAFAICTAVDPEILLMDEWISVGDAEFAQAAGRRLDSLIARTGIFVLATHVIQLIHRTCNRAIWLDHGRVMRDGPVAEVMAALTSSPPGHQAEARQQKQ